MTGVAEGTANIVYTVTDGVTGCVNSSTSAITVNALPTITTTGTVSAKCFSTTAQTTTLPYSATSGTLNNYSIDWDATANAAGLSDQGSTSIALSSSTTGTFGNGLDFDGVNDRVKFTRSVQDDFTIEFWMKTTQIGGGRSGSSQWYSGKGLVDAEVGGVQSDFGVTLLQNKVAFGVGYPDKTIYSNTTVNTGNWVHVAVTRKKSTGEMKIYINGVLESSYTHANKSSLTASAILHLGYDTNNNSLGPHNCASCEFRLNNFLSIEAALKTILAGSFQGTKFGWKALSNEKIHCLKDAAAASTFPTVR
jgi:hypothetical protein